MEVKEIVQKLIGPIYPVGKSEVDAERLENLKKMCELVDDLITEIDSVAYHNRHSREASVKACAEFASAFLDKTIKE